MLSLTNEYALRSAVYLAQHEAAQPIPGHRIAEALGIPSKYLSVILRDLVRVGVLQASPGKSGGFRLARAFHAACDESRAAGDGERACGGGGEEDKTRSGHGFRSITHSAGCGIASGA